MPCRSVTPLFGPLELVLLVVGDPHLLLDLPGANFSGTLLDFPSAGAYPGPSWNFPFWPLLEFLSAGAYRPLP
jgi:hypothetical protein